MMIPVLLAIISSAIAGPTTQGPLLAVVPPGSNLTMTWEAGQQPPSILAGSLKNIEQLTDKSFHRLEFQILDYQLNQTAPFAKDLMQSIEIYMNLTFGQHPRQAGLENFSEGEDGTATSRTPASVTGYTQLFSGLYSGVGEHNNKMNLDRTITGDMCGVIQDKGYFDVWVRPLSPQTAGAFQEGYFFCFFTLDIKDETVQEPDAQFGKTLVCDSGSLNNYSHRLWYKIRYYNIDSKTCNSGNTRTF